MIYWFIGQPACGKTTLAKMFKPSVPKCLYMDGDDLRKIFGNAYGPEHFTKEYRQQWTRTLQKFVGYIADQGINVVIATVNPYRDIREEFKSSRKDVVEIYVHKTDASQREYFNVSDYEEPLTNFISINTTGHTPEQSLQELAENFARLDLL